MVCAILLKWDQAKLGISLNPYCLQTLLYYIDKPMPRVAILTKNFGVEMSLFSYKVPFLETRIEALHILERAQGELRQGEIRLSLPTQTCPKTWCHAGSVFGRICLRGFWAEVLFSIFNH